MTANETLREQMRIKARAVVQIDGQSGSMIDHVEKALVDVVEPYRKLLGEMEWIQNSDGRFECQRCHAGDWGRPPGGHGPYCELAALLGLK